MSWDRDILDWVNPDQPIPALDLVMVMVSLLGYMVPFALLGFAALRPGQRSDVMAFWGALLVTELVVATLKFTIDRPRPEDVRLLLHLSESPSMPSGHAARAFAGLFAFWRLGNAWRVPLGLFALATLVSRPYVGAHYPSDVLMGAMIGSLMGITAYLLLLWSHRQLARPPEERGAFFERVFSTAVYIHEIDYLYSLRLINRLTQEQAARFRRILHVYGRLRFFMPIVMILLGVVAYALIFPNQFGPSASCIGAYFVPIVGIEVGIASCLALGLPAWLIVSTIIYLDLWLSLFFILNFDFLHRVPRLGALLLKNEERGLRLIRRYPWLLRLEFLGVSLVTFFPVPGAGIVPGVLVGRFIGMPRLGVWGAVMLGTLLRVSLFTYSLAGLLGALR